MVTIKSQSIQGIGTIAEYDGFRFGSTVQHTKSGKVKAVRSLVAIEAAKQQRRDKVRANTAAMRARRKAIMEKHASNFASGIPDIAVTSDEDATRYDARLMSKAAIYGLALDESLTSVIVRKDGSHARVNKAYMDMHTRLNLHRPQGFSKAQGNLRDTSQKWTLGPRTAREVTAFEASKLTGLLIFQNPDYTRAALETPVPRARNHFAIYEDIAERQALGRADVIRDSQKSGTFVQSGTFPDYYTHGHTGVDNRTSVGRVIVGALPVAKDDATKDSGAPIVASPIVSEDTLYDLKRAVTRAHQMHQTAMLHCEWKTADAEEHKARRAALDFAKTHLEDARMELADALNVPVESLAVA